jgi:hypothetical protein
MRFAAILSFLSLVTLAILPNSASAQAPAPKGAAVESPIGKVVSLEGTVTIERSAAIVRQVNAPSGAVPPKAGDFVYKGDVVQTGADGKVSLAFADGTAFNVSNNARMELNEFVYNPNSKSNSSLFNLVKGSFTFVAGKIAKTGSMKVDTPAATMGIRGTTPHVVISEDGTVKFSTLVEEKK